jgi:SAM-dependent methyltransferase
MNYYCPICNYSGSFSPFRSREAARCPKCGSLERQRAQYLILLAELATGLEPGPVLHVAPEESLAVLLRCWSTNYISLDLDPKRRPTLLASLTKIPAKSRAFQIILCSHVLEHIADVNSAIAEVARVLAPTGIAILEVPTVHGTTRQISPDSNIDGHHWECGRDDWADRYRKHFASVRAVHPAMACMRTGGNVIYICSN